jgi:hypothetical protein
MSSANTASHTWSRQRPHIARKHLSPLQTPVTVKRLLIASKKRKITSNLLSTLNEKVHLEQAMRAQRGVQV